MKKILLTILVCIGTTAFNHIKAQDVIYGGFKLAPTYSIFTEKPADGFTASPGFSVGYFEVLELSNKINLQAEVNYSNYAYTFTVPGTTSKEKFNYNALELPFLVKYRVAESFAIGAGYQFALTGDKSSGLLFDANFKTNKTIIGIRGLKTINDMVVGTGNPIQASFYIGFGIF
jgi:hypothetical protein